MSKQNIFDARLIRLAEHLESNNLGHAEFDFGEWNTNKGNAERAEGCGTNGCAIGECPIAFPDEWEFAEAAKTDYVPLLKIQPTGYSPAPRGHAKFFFGIDDAQFEHLFLPDGFNSKYGGLLLRNDAKPEQVAKNIRMFVDAWPYEKREACHIKVK